MNSVSRAHISPSILLQFLSPLMYHVLLRGIVVCIEKMDLLNQRCTMRRVGSLLMIFRECDYYVVTHNRSARRHIQQRVSSSVVIQHCEAADSAWPRPEVGRLICPINRDFTSSQPRWTSKQPCRASSWTEMLVHPAVVRMCSLLAEG